MTATRILAAAGIVIAVTFGVSTAATLYALHLYAEIDT